jgi:hypothetical protein
VKWRFLTILRAISNSDRYVRNIIPVSIVSLMYAEHVLRVPVDWSTLPSTGFGRLSEIYLTTKPAQIAYVVVPDWFRSNPALLDDPESPIPANRKPWSLSRPRKRRRVSADNELDRDLGAVFAQMEMIGAGQAMTGADWVFTGPDGMMVRPDRVEIRGMDNISVEEQSKLLADVAVYKARILFLESKLAELGFTEDASNDDSIVWGEELFEDRGVEKLEYQAEDQAPIPTAPVFPPNEADRKGKCQMADFEL